MAAESAGEGEGLFVRVFVARRLTIDASWGARNVSSPFWRLYRHDRSGARLRLGPGAAHALTPGRIHLVPAWVPFTCHNTRPLEQLYVHFDVIGLPGVLGREVFDAPLALPPSPRLEAEAEALREPLEDGPRAASVGLRVKGLVHGALAAAFDGLDANRRGRLEALVTGGGPLLPAMRYVEAHLAEPLDNRILGRLCHMSPDHFIRRFRAHTGTTPRRFVVERRIAAAAQRLVLTGDSLEAIASACGFANRHYFTRVFRRHMGVPPARYRTMTRRGGAP